MEVYDVIVVGLGAMGSAATYQLAKGGAKVLGIDRHTPPHVFGSTHGDTRITRLAIGEGAEYVPLVKRSHELWRKIEKESGEELFIECGGLIMSSVENNQVSRGVNEFLEQTVASAKKYHIEHETLTTEQIHKRFPQFGLVGDEKGYYEPQAGYVLPEKAVKAQLDLAAQNGATIHTSEKVQSFVDKDELVEVKTDKATYKARQLIITAGPWVSELVPEYAKLFKVYRQVLYWFDIADKSEYQMYKNMPIYIWEFDGQHGDSVYGFPAVDGPNGGIKIATEDYEVQTTPEKVSRVVTQEETDHMYENTVRQRMPGLSRTCLRTASCLYTVTPDHKFIIDVHPEHKNIIVASPCSGHGFKHSAAIGETLAQLATTGKTTIDISSFSFDRFK